MAAEQEIRYPRTVMVQLADLLIEIVQEELGSKVGRVEAAGSLRRERPTSKDIDIVVEALTPNVGVSLRQVFEQDENTDEILTSGDQELSMLYGGVHVDFRISKPEEYGATLLFFTGSATFSIAMRSIAKKKGLLLNRHGLFDRLSGEKLAGESEEGIFKLLGKKYYYPSERDF